MNIAVFIPIGMMLGIILREVVWWKAIFVGMGISMTIELLQLILMRGCCETDDVIHNTLGCLVGYCVTQISQIAQINNAHTDLTDRTDK